MDDTRDTYLQIKALLTLRNPPTLPKKLPSKPPKKFFKKQPLPPSPIKKRPIKSKIIRPIQRSNDRT